MPPTPRMFIRMPDRDRRLIRQLRQRWGLGDDSETIRAAIRRAAEQEGIELESPELLLGSNFNAFSEPARNVFALAQEEAQRLSHDYLGTEHILLGLLRESEDVAARALAALDVDLTKVRDKVETIIGHGPPKRGTQRETTVTPRAKRVMELAVKEARHHKHPYAGTEHLLLGLLREGEGVAAGVLAQLGVTEEQVRRRVAHILNERNHDQAARVEALSSPDLQSTLQLLADPAVQSTLQKLGRVLDSPKFQALLNESDGAQTQPPTPNP